MIYISNYLIIEYMMLDDSWRWDNRSSNGEPVRHARILNCYEQYIQANKKHIKYNHFSTLVSEIGDTGKAFRDLLASSSEEQSVHRKLSNVFACSIVIPMQEGWNLHFETCVRDTSAYAIQKKKDRNKKTILGELRSGKVTFY